jgi:IS605 OrfB family transposase
LIFNGKPLKSINQYYNKKRGKLRSELEKKNKLKTSKRLRKLDYKRNNKINDYLHKTSRLLVNQLVSNHVKTLIIGKNIGQNQDINMGKVNNQNFTQIPLFRFLDMVCYKSRLEGIEIIWQEESYTSKASFLNLDIIPIYGESHNVEFSGYRQNRGLYKVKGEDIVINADINGSYNIMRKAIPNVFTDGIEGFAVNPIKLYV